MRIVCKCSFRCRLVTFSLGLVGCLLLISSGQQRQRSFVACSAIPMWEFLTKNEKVEILQQVLREIVDVRCFKMGDSKKKDPNCQQRILSMARDKLQTLTEFEIDLLDPLQRNAHSIIWNSLFDKNNYVIEYEEELFDEFNNVLGFGDQYSIETNKLSAGHDDDAAADDHHHEQESQIIEKKIPAGNRLFSKLFTVLSSMYTNELEDRVVEIRLFPNGSQVPETQFVAAAQDDHQHHEQIK